MKLRSYGGPRGAANGGYADVVAAGEFVKRSTSRTRVFTSQSARRTAKLGTPDGDYRVEPISKWIGMCR
jgi:hypothetical protein